MVFQDLPQEREDSWSEQEKHRSQNMLSFDGACCTGLVPYSCDTEA